MGYKSKYKGAEIDGKLDKMMSTDVYDPTGSGMVNKAASSNRTKSEDGVKTLNPSDWTQVGELWQATIVDEKINSDCKISSYADIPTQPVADAAGIYAQVTGDIATNSFVLTAKSQPTGTVNINYTITYTWA